MTRIVLQPLARLASGAAMLAAFLFLFGAAVSATGTVQAQQKKLEPLTIVTKAGRHQFKVEVMRTDAERGQGLMFRRHMAADRGMLFDFEKDQPVFMWMKNTYLPLDMLFIDRRGQIVNIAENTEPLSEETIASQGPVRAVLEVNAGTARKLGIRAGDLVLHKMFRK